MGVEQARQAVQAVWRALAGLAAFGLEVQAEQEVPEEVQEVREGQEEQRYQVVVALMNLLIIVLEEVVEVPLPDQRQKQLLEAQHPVVQCLEVQYRAVLDLVEVVLEQQFLVAVVPETSKHQATRYCFER